MIKSKVQGSRFKVLIFSLLLTAYCLLPEITYAQPTYDSVAAFTAKTTIGVTDIFPFQTKVSNKYTWRKITGASMWDRITDTTEARITALLAASNSWAGINNFDGATFNADAHGKVTFADSVVSATLLNFFAGIFPYNATSFVGSASNPYLRMYSKNFVLVSTGGDSAYISLDTDDKINIPNLLVTESIGLDSAVGFSSFNLIEHSVEVSDVGDSVISAGQRMASINLSLPGDMQEGFETLNMAGFSVGDIVIIYTLDPTDTCFFIDSDVGDADCNMNLEGNFNMGAYDNLALICVSAAEGVANWAELWRKDN